MANGILVLVEHHNGRPKKTAFELISRAATLGAGPVSAAVIGGDGAAMASELASYGASRVFVVSGPDFNQYQTGPWTAALTEVARKADPMVVLAAATPIGRDMLPRVAARLGTGIAADCTDLTSAAGGRVKARRPLYAGKAIADVEIPTSSPQVFSIRPNSFIVPAPGAGNAEVVNVSVSVTGADSRARLKEVLKGAVGKIELTEAERIVAGGRSLKSAEGFATLQPTADLLGAAVGASRAAVDAGYAPHDMQVGQTGKTVNPTLYFAVGISGAIQHLAGMRTSKVIVAINKDPDAPIFQVADYGVVADLFEFMPALAAELKKALA